MDSIRNSDIDQVIRDLAGDDLTDEQVTQIRHRAYRYTGEVYVEAVPSDEFWAIVQEVSA